MDKIKLQLLQHTNNSGAPPQISFNTNPTTRKKPDKKQYLLKVDMKNNMEEVNSETVSIYITMFNTGTAMELLKFLIILNNTLKGQDLTTGPQMYAIEKKFLAGEALRV